MDRTNDSSLVPFQAPLHPGGSKPQTAFAAGQGPDIFIISPADFLRYYNGGVLVDLSLRPRVMPATRTAVRVPKNGERITVQRSETKIRTVDQATISYKTCDALMTVS
jgi:hypothetical protein